MNTHIICVFLRNYGTFSLNYDKIPTLSVALEHAQLQNQLGREFIHRQRRKKILDEYRLVLQILTKRKTILIIFSELQLRDGNASARDGLIIFDL